MRSLTEGCLARNSRNYFEKLSKNVFITECVTSPRLEPTNSSVRRSGLFRTRKVRLIKKKKNGNFLMELFR